MMVEQFTLEISSLFMDVILGLHMVQLLLWHYPILYLKIYDFLRFRDQW